MKRKSKGGHLTFLCYLRSKGLLVTMINGVYPRGTRLINLLYVILNSSLDNRILSMVKSNINLLNHIQVSV